MASVQTYVADLVGAMRLDRDAESIKRANEGLSSVEGAVKERNGKYQELIAGAKKHNQNGSQAPEPRKP